MSAKRDEIETVDYQAAAAVGSRPCGASGAPHCVDAFPDQPSRWCSGCLIAVLLRRLDKQHLDGCRSSPCTCRLIHDEMLTLFETYRRANDDLREQLALAESAWHAAYDALQDWKPMSDDAPRGDESEDV